MSSVQDQLVTGRSLSQTSQVNNSPADGKGVREAFPGGNRPISQKDSSKAIEVDRRFKTLDMTMKRHQYKAAALIEVLHKAQEAFGYLEDEVLVHIARGLKLPLSKVYGVATFYHLFSLKPSGLHSCVVCLGTACYVKGSGEILSRVEKHLGIHAGETTPDGQVSLMTARCIGACGIAPAIVFDGEVAGKLDGSAVLAKVQSWQAETSNAGE